MTKDIFIILLLLFSIVVIKLQRKEIKKKKELLEENMKDLLDKNIRYNELADLDLGFKDYAPYYENLPVEWKNTSFFKYKNHLAAITSDTVKNLILNRLHGKGNIQFRCAMKVISFTEKDNGISLLLQDPFIQIPTTPISEINFERATKLLNLIVVVDGLIFQNNYIQVIELKPIDLSKESNVCIN